MASVYIPVQNSEEEVRVVVDQLPRDASDIIDILKAEQAPLDIWLIIAREYFKQGKVDQFLQILQEGSTSEIDEYYADVRFERIAILNALGAYYSYIGKIETKQREKEELFIMATQYYNKASRIDMHEPSTWVGKGQLLLAKGDTEQASAAFKIVLDGDRDNVPALLGQACVYFNNGRYSDSLELYKHVLQVFPQCPASVRLGIGYCRYKLGQIDKAKQAFQRVLQLDPQNSDALVALGILDLQTSEAVNIRKGMVKLQRAFEIYPYCANSLNYLANHFFFTGQHFLVEQLTETALAVSTHGPTKSRSYYNLARSYQSKGDYEKAGMYYMASVKENSKPREFILPYYGLGQVQLKLGDLISALANFEKVLEVYPENCDTLKVVGHVYFLLGQIEKAHEFFKKATKADPRDPHAFIDLGEVLISSDASSALDAFKTGRDLFVKRNEEVPVELLNNIGVLHMERGELELAEQAFKDALGEGLWFKFLDVKQRFGSDNQARTEANKEHEANILRSALYPIDSSESINLYKDFSLFDRLEQHFTVRLPHNKVSSLFNLALLLEQLHDCETASIFYRFILYKYPSYIDAYLRLAAIAKSLNNFQHSTELISDALNVDDKCENALLMLGDLELKTDNWVKAKDTFRSAAGENDSYVSLCLANWNYFAAIRSEKRAPKLEIIHLNKAMELYSKALSQHTGNLYAANGAGVILAEKGHFDASKKVLTQVQEAASVPDVWINLAHVHFAQGNFAIAVKMYQNCLRKFYYNTDSQVLLYLARTHYEAEQWHDCKKTLLRAIHLNPSNHTLRFDVGVSLQKYSASTLQKTKRTVEEVKSTVSELKNAVRIFTLLLSASGSNLHIHGFDEKKMETHVEYCKHLLDAAKVHCEAAEREELQNKQKLELARQVMLADETRRKAEEERRFQLEKRKQEDELKQVMQQEQNLQRLKEHWKSNDSSSSKRKDRAPTTQTDDEKRRKKGGKRRRKKENDYDDLIDENNSQNDILVAAGLEDSDGDDDVIAARSSPVSESGDDEPDNVGGGGGMDESE